MNLILIGMPGSGKTTIGKALAQVRGMTFLDTDIVLQRAAGMTLAHIIQHQGQEGFMELEAAIIPTINSHNTVISTGGSVPLNQPAMAHLKSIGKVIFMDVAIHELMLRIEDPIARGVVGAGDMSLPQIHAQRLPYYTKYADLTLEIPAAEPTEQTLTRLQALL